MNRNRLLKILGAVVLVVFLFLLPAFWQNVYWISVLVTIGINILLTSSLRSLNLIDHLSLGHVGFALIGAYGSALLVTRLGFSFWETLFIAGFVCSALGLALGYPILKVKGMYFCILTILIAESFRLIAFYWRDVTGGTYGLTGIPSPNPITLPLIGTIKFESETSYYYLVLVIVLVTLLILYSIEHSYIGTRWRAIRDTESLSQAIGINVIWYKMVNFAIACFFAGISGAVFAHYQHNLSADFGSRFGVTMSIYLLTYMVVGGADYFAGPIIGTVVLTLLAELFRTIGEFQPMISGMIAILVMLFMPGGLVSLLGRSRKWLRRSKLMGQSNVLK
jgi:branched-chain amino acid transport system permease protein